MNTLRFLQYVWPFCNIMHERVKSPKCKQIFETLCTIWYHLYNLKELQLATLVKVALLHGCFSRLFKLYKWHQIAQSIMYLMNDVYIFQSGSSSFIFTLKLSSLHETLSLSRYNFDALSTLTLTKSLSKVYFTLLKFLNW